MSHKPILTSASLYEQGAPTPVRRLIASVIRRGAGPLVVEQPQAPSTDTAEQAAVCYLQAADRYTKAADDARSAGNLAYATRCDARAASCRKDAADVRRTAMTA